MEKIKLKKIVKEITKQEFKKLNEKEQQSGGKEEYTKFFMKALDKFGVDEPDQFDSEEKKKEFFDYVDKKWKADKETDED